MVRTCNVDSTLFLCCQFGIGIVTLDDSEVEVPSVHKGKSVCTQRVGNRMVRNIAGSQSHNERNTQTETPMTSLPFVFLSIAIAIKMVIIFLSFYHVFSTERAENDLYDTIVILCHLFVHFCIDFLYHCILVLKHYSRDTIKH